MFLSPEDAAMLTDLAQRYAAAYLRARSPGTRSKVATAHKNDVRKEAWRTVRPMSMRIKHNRAIGDAKKIELGVRRPHRSQSPIPRPRHAPTLAIVRMSGGVHRLRYWDSANPDRQAKPPGVTEMQLAVVIAAAPVGSAGISNVEYPRACRQAGNPKSRQRRIRRGGQFQQSKKKIQNQSDTRRLLIQTRHVFDVKFESQDAGRTATYFGRWVTRRGLTGPWSAPVSGTILCAGVRRAA